MARGGRQIGSKLPLEGRYAYGDDAEIANRDKVGFQNRASRFNQPGPADKGGSLAHPKHNVKSGNFKYNPPVS